MDYDLFGANKDGVVACDNCNFPCDRYGYCWKENDPCTDCENELCLASGNNECWRGYI